MRVSSSSHKQKTWPGCRSYLKDFPLILYIRNLHAVNLNNSTLCIQVSKILTINNVAIK